MSAASVGGVSLTLEQPNLPAFPFPARDVLGSVPDTFSDWGMPRSRQSHNVRRLSCGLHVA